MKLLLAGDPHGDLMYFRLVNDLAKKEGADRIVLLGDVGMGWTRKQFKGRNGQPGDQSLQCPVIHALEGLFLESGIPVLILDGNHENFDWLDGQKADRGQEADGTYLLGDGVTYVPRGTVLTLGSSRVLFMGGATSMDKDRRVNHITWWEQEAITSDDVKAAVRSGQADLMLSHDLPYEGDCATASLEHWPVMAVHATRANSWRVSEVLRACGARRLVHGHLHYRYDEWVDVGNTFGPVLVQGLDCSGSGLDNSTMLIDTDDLRTGLAANTTTEASELP